MYLPKIGQDVHITGGSFEEAVDEGVRQGYTEGYLRKSVVADPIRRGNTGDNTPAVLTVRLVPGDKLRLTLAPKGFGSENMSRLAMLRPSDGEQGVKDFVLDAVRRAGPNPCPPVVVGVGIGGTMELAALCAKRAAMRSFAAGENLRSSMALLYSLSTIGSFQHSAELAAAAAQMSADGRLAPSGELRDLPDRVPFVIMEVDGLAVLRRQRHDGVHDPAVGLVGDCGIGRRLQPNREPPEPAAQRVFAGVRRRADDPGLLVLGSLEPRAGPMSLSSTVWQTSSASCVDFR